MTLFALFYLYILFCAGESWLCLSCYKVHCSRQDHGHGAEHAEVAQHHVAVSYADLSTWCYACDAYIKADQVRPILGKLHEQFFGVANPALSGPSGSATASGNDATASGNDAGDDKGLAEAVASLSLSSGTTAPAAAVAATPTPKRRGGGLLKARTLEAVADYIREKNVKRIVLLTGAGVSTAAGIPDFRSPGTGLYHNLAKYNLPDPMAIFTLSFFAKNPKPFYTLAKELYPANFKPTFSHHFVKLLENKRLLQRNFTQNIDTLERAAGVSDEMLVEAHGSFATSRCIDCGKAFDSAAMEEHIMAEKVPHCAKCDGYAKPDIVFFGENLPERFFELNLTDLYRADLLIVMGTSLKVLGEKEILKKKREND